MTIPRQPASAGHSVDLDHNKRSSRRARLDARLAAYSAMAGAAVAATGQSAHAGLVVNDFADVHLVQNDTGGVDIDNNSVIDVSFSQSFSSAFVAVALRPRANNSAVASYNGGYAAYLPLAFNAGQSLTTGAAFVGGTDPQTMALLNRSSSSASIDSSYGNWTGGQSNKFVGVKFKIGTESHLGFVQVSVASESATDPFAITIHGAGYNDIPIGDASGMGDSLTFQVVPEPSSLGLLALGATGVLMHRKRRRADVA